MLCLHGKPAVASTTENGTFWTCSEPSVCFVCSEEEKHLYDKAIKAFLATKQDRPRCCGIVPAAQKAYISRYWANYIKYKTYTSNDTVDEKPPKRYDPYKYLGPFVSAADVERNYAKFRVYTGTERISNSFGHIPHDITARRMVAEIVIKICKFLLLIAICSSSIKTNYNCTTSFK